MAFRSGRIMTQHIEERQIPLGIVIARLDQKNAGRKLPHSLPTTAGVRLPEKDETAEISRIIAKRGDRGVALREFVWALIGSREFAENH